MRKNKGCRAGITPFLSSKFFHLILKLSSVSVGWGSTLTYPGKLFINSSLFCGYAGIHFFALFLSGGRGNIKKQTKQKKKEKSNKHSKIWL